MVAGPAPGHLPFIGGPGSLHARFESALALHVFCQVTGLNAMAPAIVAPGLRFSDGVVGSLAPRRTGRAGSDGGGSPRSGLCATACATLG